MPIHQNGVHVNGLPRPKNILKLSDNEKRNFLNSFDIVLTDCDGVVWMMSNSIPNTGPAINLLKQADKHVKFVSNNSMRTDDDYLKKLNGIGVKDVRANDIVHPAKTIVRYIKQNLPNQPVFSLCSSVMNKSLEENGIIIKSMTPQLDLCSENLVERLTPKEKVGAVILDLNFNITFGELAMAQQYLHQDKCVLLVGASDARVPFKEFITIGSSGFLNILEEITGKKGIILGKPGEALGASLIETFNIKDPSRVLFIGDSLKMDIEFGKKLGFQTLFVLSGASTYEQMLEVPEQYKPDYIGNGLADFIEFFKNLN